MSEKFRATVPPSTALKVLKLRRQGMAVTEVTPARDGDVIVTVAVTRTA